MTGEIDRRFRTSNATELRNTVKPPRPVERYRRGEVLRAAKLSRMADAVNRANTLAAPAQSNGLRERVTGIFEARVLAEYDDFLHCQIFPLSGTPEDIIVAKPHTLRRNPWEGSGRGMVTFEYGAPGQPRVATFVDQVSGETIEADQYIVPPYLEGDLLYVSNGIIGGVGIFAGTFEIGNAAGNTGEQETAEHFIDLNVCGRQWAAEVVCEPPIEISTDPIP